MSEILNNLVIQPITATIVVGTTPISITPTATQLNIYASAAPGNIVATSLNANISNVHISGGNNGYVLQTDGTGNLNWTAQTGGGGGNGSPGGSNTQIQFNDAGTFGGVAGFTFDKVSNVLSAPGNISTAGYQGNITGANVISSLTLSTINLNILSNTNPNTATSGNTIADFKYPITINGNIYYICLSANI